MLASLARTTGNADGFSPEDEPRESGKM